MQPDRAIITDEEAKEVGIKKEVYQDWADLMQALWSASIVFYSATEIVHGEKFLPKNEDNEIFIGDKYKINANFVNNSYVEACLYEGNTQLAEIRFCGDVNAICLCFFVIIRYNEGIYVDK